MPSAPQRHEKELADLITRGLQLDLAIEYECDPMRFRARAKNTFGNKVEEVIRSLPSFREAYEGWYPEAKALVRQLLPHRLDDFVRHYEKPKSRKDITYESYVIADFLQGLQVTRGHNGEVVVGRDAALPHFRQQLAILKGLQRSLASSLYAVRQLLQADLLDSELDTATLLAKSGYLRAAGALAGVVLERHLSELCANRLLTTGKKKPTIATLNNALKEAGVLEVADWRFVQHLADLRNVCTHKGSAEPTPEQVADLIAGVSKMIKPTS